MELESYLSVKELAARLGLAEVTIRQWIGEDKITSIKIGSARRIPESEYIRLTRGA